MQLGGKLDGDVVVELRLAVGYKREKIIMVFGEVGKAIWVWKVRNNASA